MRSEIVSQPVDSYIQLEGGLVSFETKFGTTIIKEILDLINQHREDKLSMAFIGVREIELSNATGASTILKIQDTYAQNVTEYTVEIASSNPIPKPSNSADRVSKFFSKQLKEKFFPGRKSTHHVLVSRNNGYTKHDLYQGEPLAIGGSHSKNEATQVLLQKSDEPNKVYLVSPSLTTKVQLAPSGIDLASRRDPDENQIKQRRTGIDIEEEFGLDDFEEMPIPDRSIIQGRRGARDANDPRVETDSLPPADVQHETITFHEGENVNLFFSRIFDKNVITGKSVFAKYKTVQFTYFLSARRDYTLEDGVDIRSAESQADKQEFLGLARAQIVENLIANRLTQLGERQGKNKNQESRSISPKAGSDSELPPWMRDLAETPIDELASASPKDESATELPPWMQDLAETPLDEIAPQSPKIEQKNEVPSWLDSSEELTRKEKESFADYINRIYKESKITYSPVNFKVGGIQMSFEYDPEKKTFLSGINPGNEPKNSTPSEIQELSEFATAAKAFVIQ